MTNKSRNSIQSIDRALDILEVLSIKKDGMGISAVAKSTGLSKSTAHRIAASLMERGYIDQVEATGFYRLGHKYIETVSQYINRMELQSEARPFLWDLAAELGLTTHLGVLDAHEVVYAEKLDVFPNIRIYSQAGFRVPAYCSSLGKCLLSGLSSDDLESVMTHCAFERFTDKTITNLKELKQQLKQVRLQGWAMDDQEHDLMYRCIGAPIIDYRGDIVAAISASGPIDILTDERIPEVVEKVKLAAMRLSEKIGCVPKT